MTINHMDGTTIITRTLSGGQVIRITVPDSDADPVRLYESVRSSGWVERACSEKIAATHRRIAARSPRGESDDSDYTT
jgi:hypothetical protein